jgi:hypothetical protein
LGDFTRDDEDHYLYELCGNTQQRSPEAACAQRLNQALFIRNLSQHSPAPQKVGSNGKHRDEQQSQELWAQSRFGKIFGH